MKLFAYAGNMNVEEFSKVVPSAKKIGIAKLPGYRFIFNKTAEDQSSKANIIPSAEPEEIVWGILIEFDENEKPNFYNPDTWSSDFKLERVTCFDPDDEIHHAETFIAHPHAVNSHLLPYDWYHKKMIRLAKYAQLPAQYINKIFLMKFKTDPDDGRRLRWLYQLKQNEGGDYLASHLY